MSSVFFILSPFMEVVLVRHRKKEQRYGPSPANDYTSGSGRKPGFFASLRGKNGNTHPDADLMSNKLPEHTTPADVRDSYATEQTRVGGAPENTGAYGSYNPYNEASVGNTYTPPNNNSYNKYDMSFGQQQQDIAMGQYPQGGGDHVYDRR